MVRRRDYCKEEIQSVGSWVEKRLWMPNTRHWSITPSYTASMQRVIAAAAALLWVCPLSPQEAPHVNRLAQETSPYLLQHQHNPVDWYPWGEEALEKAKKDDKPIFLSIGYSACHWCHVMERESFENPEIAAVMNEHFVNIKVDREERPDLDEIYMSAVQGMTGHGGWPMSVWMTPDLKPFYSGEHFTVRRNVCQRVRLRENFQGFVRSSQRHRMRRESSAMHDAITDFPHDVFAAGDDRDRIAVCKGLGEGTQVGLYTH